MRTTLTILRAATLLLLLFIIYEATLHFRYVKIHPPLLAVAIDNTASMTITDNNGSRRNIVKNILGNPIMSELDKKFDIKYYSFSNSIEMFSPRRGDTLNFLGDATNIRQSLEKIKAENVSENLNNILLISDGNYNTGGNPVRYAEELGVPVFTVGVGSSQPVTDLAITTVEANPFAYANQPTPLQVTVRNTGFDNLTVPVEVQHNGTTVVRDVIQLAPSPSEKTVALSFTPKEVGRQKLDLVVPRQTGEHLIENNSRSLYIDVLKAKLKILLIAGAVSPDITFFKRRLQNDRYQIQDLVYKNGGEFYEPLPSRDEIQDIDIFVFLDFPIRGLNPTFQQNLLSSLESKKQPVLFIPGINTSLPDLTKFSDYLPVQAAVKMQKETSISVELSPLGNNHPIMQVSSDPVVSKTVWRELPPVFAPLTIQQLAPGAEVLAYARLLGTTNRTLSPLIAIRSNGLQKSAGIFASQLWRWDFMMHGINRSDDVYSHLLQNIIRWLETNRSESLVRVNMDKTQYRFGDPIPMKIDVFDENLNPVENADVRVSLQQKGNVEDFPAQPHGKGAYSVTLQAPQPGDFEAQVSADVNGRRLGEETVLFSVGEYSAELTDLQAQPTVLQSLSRATGGQYVSSDSLAILPSIMQGRQTTTPLTSENELWNNKYLLFLILFLLTTEWFVRKRRGMV